MYKVLLVDDELLIRTHLKTMINWENHDFVLGEEAVNGQEALKRIEKEMPDIVLSDIRMPVMDGVQLSSEIHRSYPHIKLIMLSNFDDFEYVKNTLKNGAIDYILKHNISEDVLLATLNRAKEMIKAQMTDKRTPLERNISNNLIALRERFVIQLLSGVYRNEDEIRHHLGMLDIRMETKNICAIIMVIDHYKFLTEQNKFRDIALKQYAVLNIAEEIINDFGNGIISHIANEKFVMLVSFQNNRSLVQIDNTISKLLNRIAECLKAFLNISVSYSIGSMVGNITDTIKSYETAEIHLENKFYQGQNSVLINTQKTSEEGSFAGLSIEKERQIIHCVKLFYKTELLILLKDIFNDTIKLNLKPTASQTIFSDLLSIINRVCKENDIEGSAVYSSTEAPYHLLSKFETFDEICEWINELYIRLVEMLDAEGAKSYSDYVKKAIKLIKQHYSENISLSSVADRINVSSNYLSTLFKEEVGQGFSDYLIHFRLERAKSILEERKNDIKENVDLCGFSDYAYFFKIFKKKLGVTPKEFLKNYNE